MPEYTILIVDDEKKIADVLTSYLEKEGYAVVCANSGREAIRQFNRYTPALVILDLMLPDLPGEDVCREIRQKSKAPILMLTAKTQEEEILRGLRLGADDYVTKPFSPRQVVARVAAILRRTGGQAAAAEVLTFPQQDLVIDDTRHEVSLHGEPVALTPSEFRILRALVGHMSKTFTREELIALAFGDEFDGYDRVIDTHIKNIRQKIEPEPKTPRYILTVHGIGYKFNGGAG